MINDDNEVRLEGIVFRTPEEFDTDGKKVMNFAIENTRYTANGVDRQLYNCVAWNKAVERFGGRIVEGARVRIKGHLQSNVYVLPDGKEFKYTKVCVDFLEAE